MGCLGKAGLPVDLAAWVYWEGKSAGGMIVEPVKVMIADFNVESLKSFILRLYFVNLDPPGNGGIVPIEYQVQTATVVPSSLGRSRLLYKMSCFPCELF